MNFEIQFSRIANSGKLPDRFLACQHLTTDDLGQKSMGEIFALVEMLSPWFPTAQVGQMVINNFAKYYYQGESTSDLDNFENSLKKINEDLAQITQNGETDWIGNLNGLICVIVGNSMHITSTGQVESYMLRDGKINHLTEGMTGPSEPHPLKTFTNVISGELKSQDKIIISNKELYNHLSLESIRQIVSLNSPSTAAMQLSKLLKKEKALNVNVIIVGIGLQDEISGQTLSEAGDNVFYLDKSSDSLIKKFQSLTQVVSPVFKSISGKVGGASKELLNKIPKKKENAPTEAQKINNDRFHKEFLSTDPRDDSLLKDEEIQYSPDLYVHYYNEKKNAKTKNNKWLNYLKNGLSWVFKKIALFIKWVIESWKDKSRRKFVYILAAGILVLIIVLIVLFSGKENKVSNIQAQKILEEAISLQKDGRNLLGSGSPDQAKEKFASSISKAKEIKDNLFVSKEAKEVLNSSMTDLDKLTATTRYNELKSLAEISGNSKGIYIISGMAYVVTDSEIYEVNIVSGLSSKVTSIPKSNGEYLTGSSSGSQLFLYTNNQNLLTFDPATEKIASAKINADGKWETANSISYFSNNLYLLDGVVGQIYKHTSSQAEFSSGDEYIQATNINAREGISLAIDGSLYVLKNDGKVIEIQKGKLQDFSLKNVPTPYSTITKPLKIYTDADAPAIYVLDIGDQKRILEFDKEGQFIKQYGLPDNFENITDFFVSTKSKKIWILNDNKVYEISI